MSMVKQMTRIPECLKIVFNISPPLFILLSLLLRGSQKVKGSPKKEQKAKDQEIHKLDNSFLNNEELWVFLDLESWQILKPFYERSI